MTEQISTTTVTDPENTAMVSAESATVPTLEYGCFYRLDPNWVQTDPNQPRQHNDEKDLDVLVQSAKRYGILQPIICKIDEEGKPVVVAGERRILAARIAELETVPVVTNDGAADEIAIVENAVRCDVTPIEEAEALNRLKTMRGYKNKELALIIGKAESTVSEILSVAKLPVDIRDAIRGSKQYTRAQLLGVAGKGKTDQAMTAAFEALVQSVNPTTNKPTVPVIEQLKIKLGTITKTINTIDMSQVAGDDKTALLEELGKVVEAINLKRQTA